MTQTVTSPVCVNCGASRVPVIWRAANWSTDTRQIVQCSKYGLGFYWPPATSFEYDDDYQAERVSGGYDHTLDWERLETIQSMEPHGLVLDVGCGFGLFLDKARGLGYETMGIEPTAGASAYAKESLGLSVIQTTVEQAEVIAESLDIVTCWHVLEHLSDPVGALLKFRQWLRPGGLLAVEVPNELEGSLHRITLLKRRRGWVPYTQPPCHLFYFTLTSLVSLVTKCEYHVIHQGTHRFASSPSFWAKYNRWSFAKPALDRIVSLVGTGAMIRVFARREPTESA